MRIKAKVKVCVKRCPFTSAVLEWEYEDCWIVKSYYHPISQAQRALCVLQDGSFYEEDFNYITIVDSVIKSWILKDIKEM